MCVQILRNDFEASGFLAPSLGILLVEDVAEDIVGDVIEGCC